MFIWYLSVIKMMCLLVTSSWQLTNMIQDIIIAQSKGEGEGVNWAGDLVYVLTPA